MPKKDAKLLTLVICSVGAILGGGRCFIFRSGLPWMLQHSGGRGLLRHGPGVATSRRFTRSSTHLGLSDGETFSASPGTIDLALPLLFGWTLYAAIGNGAERAFGGARTAGGFRWMAVAAAGSDYLENTSITVLLAAYPDRASDACIRNRFA